MISKAKTVDEYLASIPADRRAAIQRVREVILANLDKGYEEGMQYGMIGYYVPHSIYPAGYHCDPKQPLTYCALASQKNYMSVYLGGLYGDPEHEAWFRKEWSKTGKRLDMGKCCVRFKKLDDLPLELVGRSVARLPLRKFINFYESVIISLRSNNNAARKKAKKAPAASKPKSKAKAGTRAKANGKAGAKTNARAKTNAKR
jgi:hypothetical protein